MQWRDADDFQLDKVNHVTVMAGNLAGTSGSDIRALSDAERECARGIADGTGRSRFVAGRAFLRRAIGHVLGDGPYRGGFVVGKFGKPYLPPPHASLSFNVSHTGDLIVAAFMRGSAIGVDVEKCDRAIPPSLPAYVFNRDELDCISTCDDWKSALLLGWTCKEAVLKCIG
jgi:4'-phosphopantetheinyl transferase